MQYNIWVWLVRFNKNKIMIDKKQLIEELLECVKDATDTETQITGLSMCATLMNEVLDEASTIPVVVPKSTLSNLDEAIKKAKPNMDKIKDVDKHLDSIR